MATHPSIFVSEIPWTAEPGRLQSMGLQRVGYNLVTKSPLPFIRGVEESISVAILFILSVLLLFSLKSFLKVKVLFAQSCLTLCHLMDCNPPGSFVQATGVVCISFPT